MLDLSNAAKRAARARIKSVKSDMALKEAKIGNDEELKALLIKDPNQIEENFNIITHQRKYSGLKNMAILGLDYEGVLTLIELKVNVDGTQLRQALEYYDWLMEQGIDWVTDLYSERLQNAIKEQTPQIFLIALDFDDRMVKEAKYIRPDIKVKLFRYLALEINGKKEIKLMETPIQQALEIEREPSITENKEIRLTETPISIKRKPETIQELIGAELYKNVKLTSDTPQDIITEKRAGWEELEKEIKERIEKELHSKLEIMNAPDQAIIQEKKAGEKTIGLTKGLNSSEELGKEKPNSIFEKFEEVLGKLVASVE